MKTDKAEIKFHLYEGRDKQTMLERYLRYDSELDYKKDFINPYTGENIESKLLGQAREEEALSYKKSNDESLFKEGYDSKEDISNLSELIRRKKQERVIVITD